MDRTPFAGSKVEPGTIPDPIAEPEQTRVRVLLKNGFSIQGVTDFTIEDLMHADDEALVWFEVKDRDQIWQIRASQIAAVLSW